MFIVSMQLYDILHNVSMTENIQYNRSPFEQLESLSFRNFMTYYVHVYCMMTPEVVRRIELVLDN